MLLYERSIKTLITILERILSMRKSYEKLRGELKEVENLLKKRMIEDMDLVDAMAEEPELIIILTRLHKLIEISDEFTNAYIDAIENQDKKLDEILSKLN